VCTLPVCSSSAASCKPCLEREKEKERKRERDRNLKRARGDVCGGREEGGEKGGGRKIRKYERESERARGRG